MNRVIKYLDGVLVFIGAIALLAMMLHVSLDVVCKYVLNKPVPLTMEMVTYYYMSAVAFLPLAALERKGGSLVHVELVYSHMPPWLRRAVLPFSLLLSALFCAAAAYAACAPAASAYAAGTYAGSIITVIIWPTRFLPILGFGLLAIVLGLKAAWHIRTGIDEDQSPADPMSMEGGA